VAFRVRREQRPNTIGRDPTIWILEVDAGNSLAVWPALGFNAYRWLVEGEDLLYCDPKFFDEIKPTRSGWPILFPFPNRIRAGHFTWAGKDYELPLNDPTSKNAIHGFAARRPWRVVDEGVGDTDAWLTAEFQASRDAADAFDLWPADYRLQITYRLGNGWLRVEATAENPGPEPLPMGLGYHPYFRVAPFGGEEAIVTVDAGKRWELVESLPTGATTTFSWHDTRFADVQLDHLFTDVPTSRPDVRHCGAIESPDGRRLIVEAARDFRDVVVFTPSHRQAICFEPYTCITDAINLHRQGVDTGLQVLPPGGMWHGWVQVSLITEPTTAA
jgi:aldose 1-epimerase